MWRPCCLSQVSNGGQKTKLLTCRYLDWLCVHLPARTDVMWQPCCLSQASNGGQKTKLLQCSQHCLQGEPHHICISYDSKSWQCSQNLHGPFLRAILPTKVKQELEQTGRQSNGVIRIFVGHSHLSNIIQSFTLDYAAQLYPTRNAIASGLLKTMWIQQAKHSGIKQ